MKRSTIQGRNKEKIIELRRRDMASLWWDADISRFHKQSCRRTKLSSLINLHRAFATYYLSLTYVWPALPLGAAQFWSGRPGNDKGISDPERDAVVLWGREDTHFSSTDRWKLRGKRPHSQKTHRQPATRRWLLWRTWFIPKPNDTLVPSIFTRFAVR